MKSIRIISTLLMIITLFSCNQSGKKNNNTANTEFTVKPLHGFFGKNGLKFEKPVKDLVITNQKDFDTYFGIAQTMKNKMPDINLDKHNIVAIMAKPNERKQIIEISASELVNDTLKVKYNVMKGAKQSFTSGALKMFKIPKSIHAVEFHSDKGTELIKI